MSKKTKQTKQGLLPIVIDMKNKLGFLHNKINIDSPKNKKSFDIDSAEQLQALELFNNSMGKDDARESSSQQPVKAYRLENILKSQMMDEEEESKQQKKGNKSVSFNFEDNIIYNLNSDRKWNDRIEKEKKGKFELDEQRILSDAVGQYIATNEIDFEQFKRWLSFGSKEEKNILRRQKFFKLLSSVLPNRSPASCYKYILRNFNEFNHQGKWTAQDEERLLALVDKYGRKWTLIGKQLGRTSDNVYDKYRSLGQQNAEERIKSLWKLRQIVSMLIQIQRQTQIQFLDHKIKQQLQAQLSHDQIESREFSEHKYNTKKFTFHNIEVIKKYIDAKLLQSVNLDSLKWKKIVRQVGNKTIFDCRNKMVTILQILFRNNELLDALLVDFLMAENPHEEIKIRWKNWRYQQYRAEEAKNRFMILKKLIQGRTSKPFSVIMHEIAIKVDKLSQAHVKASQQKKLEKSKEKRKQ